MILKRNAAVLETGIAIDQLKDDIKDTLPNEARRSIAHRASEFTEDQLKNAFKDILKLQANTASDIHSTSTTCSSSSSTGSFMVDEDAAGHPLPNAKDLDELRYIVQRMNSKGCLEKVIRVYIVERKAIMSRVLQRLGIKKPSNTEIRMLGLNTLRLKSMKWIRAANVSLQVLFPREKQLSEYIFKGLGNATYESCFLETVKDPAGELLDFVDALSTCRRSPEKIKSILFLYKGLSSHVPNINSVFFPSELGKTISVRAKSILSKLVETIRTILSDFEDALVREQSTDPAPDGTVHRITRYVMGYIGLILAKKDILEKLIISKPSMTFGESIVPDLERVLDLEGQTPLAIHVFWIIVTLRMKLEGLSKNYQDSSLANLFMMNNIHYIVNKIKRTTALKDMTGDYLKKLIENIEQATSSYLRATWDRVLDCLRNEGVHVSGIFHSGISAKVVKQRFKAFNSLIEDVQRDHERWVVPDPELRAKLVRSILDKLIRSYRSFLEQFRGHVEKGKYSQRYIKYSEEELETIVRGLFCVSRELYL